MLLLALILYYAFAYNPGIAAPITIDSDNVFLSRETGSPDLCPRKRWEIIWSCIATILAASWVSVHPNLPHPKDSKVKKAFRRIELMLWAIIMPELIIFWAMRQWYRARTMEREFIGMGNTKVHSAFKYILTLSMNLEYKKEWEATTTEHKLNMAPADQQKAEPGGNAASDVTPQAAEADTNICNHSPSTACKTKADDFKWTRTHGFFFQMGGFVLLEGKKKHILGWKHLMEYYKARQIDLSDITEASINDHSKADGFAKGLALLQTCWFIVQCIARFADHHLVLTELELVTGALAVLSLAMYFLWWNKPFNAEIPIMIILSSNSQTKSIIHNDDSESIEEDIKGG